MTHKKPDPIIPGKQPNICPVCGKASYSAAGVHPQCSVKKADLEQAEKYKEQAKTDDKQSNSKKNTKLSRWQKTCPMCKAALHVRKKACECGLHFPGKLTQIPTTCVMAWQVLTWI